MFRERRLSNKSRRIHRGCIVNIGHFQGQEAKRLQTAIIRRNHLDTDGADIGIERRSCQCSRYGVNGQPTGQRFSCQSGRRITQGTITIGIRKGTRRQGERKRCIFCGNLGALNGVGDWQIIKTDNIDGKTVIGRKLTAIGRFQSDKNRPHIGRSRCTAKRQCIPIKSQPIATAADISRKIPAGQEVAQTIANIGILEHSGG